MLERLLTQSFTMELGEEHVKQIAKDREAFTKQVPFVSAVSAGLSEIGYTSLEDAVKHISYKHLLAWLSWRYSIVVANPSLNIKDNAQREIPLIKNSWGGYILDDIKSSFELPPSGFEGYFVGNEKSVERVAKVILGLCASPVVEGNNYSDAVSSSFSVSEKLLKDLQEAERQKILQQLSQLQLTDSLNPSEVAKYIGILGALELNTARQMHRGDDPMRVDRFFRILSSNKVGDLRDVRALVEMDAIFGSMIGRMRSLLDGNKEGQYWQKQTHEGVEQYVKSIAYQSVEDRIEEKFLLPPKFSRTTQFKGKHPKWLDLPTAFNISLVEKSPQYLNLREGYAFASLIGKIGNPLVRMAMRGLQRYR